MHDKLPPLVLGAYNSRLTKLCFVFGTDLDLCTSPPPIRAQLSPLVFSSFFIPGGCHTSPPTKYPCQEYYPPCDIDFSRAARVPLRPPIDRNDIIIAIITLDFFYYHCRGPESRRGNKRRSLALLIVSLEPGPKFLFASTLFLSSFLFSTNRRKERTEERNSSNRREESFFERSVSL